MNGPDEPSWVAGFRAALADRGLDGWRVEFERDTEYDEDAVRLVGPEGQRYHDLLYVRALPKIDVHIAGAKIQFQEDAPLCGRPRSYVVAGSRFDSRCALRHGHHGLCWARAELDARFSKLEVT